MRFAGTLFNLAQIMFLMPGLFPKEGAGVGWHGQWRNGQEVCKAYRHSMRKNSTSGGEEVLKVGQSVHPWGWGDRCFMYCVAFALDVLEDSGLTIK